MRSTLLLLSFPCNVIKSLPLHPGVGVRFPAEFFFWLHGIFFWVSGMIMVTYLSWFFRFVSFRFGDSNLGLNVSNNFFQKFFKNALQSVALTRCIFDNGADTAALFCFVASTSHLLVKFCQIQGTLLVRKFFGLFVW